MSTHAFDMTTRDANGAPIEVGAVVRFYDEQRQHRGSAYIVTSVNEEPEHGDFYSTPDGPVQRIHYRIRMQDVALIYEPIRVLAESVVIVPNWRSAR